MGGARAAGSKTSDDSKWQAHWIAFPAQSESLKGSLEANQANTQRMPIFRDDFVVRKSVSKAILRISGLGQYEAHIDGNNVTDAVLTPGWTDYRKRVLYNTYNVSDLIVQGKNAIGVMLGSGMYDVRETKGRYSKFTSSFGPLKLIAELDVRYFDGTQEIIGSDATWRTSPGPITFSSAYGGEDYDARLEQLGWDGPAFDATAWSKPQLVDGPGGMMVPEPTPPVKPFGRFDPVAITHPAPNVTVYDLGQNFSGWPEIEASGERGTRVKMIAGELLDARGLRSTVRMPLPMMRMPSTMCSEEKVLNSGTLDSAIGVFDTFKWTGPSRSSVTSMDVSFMTRWTRLGTSRPPTSCSTGFID
jgi:hypothetical protein